MKRIVALLLVALLILSLAACTKKSETDDTSAAPETTAAEKETEAPTEKETEAPTEAAGGAVLEDEGHECWVAHGQYLLADGTENAWNGKDSALYEKSALTAIALDDVKGISEDVYKALSEKEVKYLYTIDLIFGTNDAGWTSNFLKDGTMYRANGSYCFKIAQCTVDMDGDTKIYAEDQWISDPKTAYAESLTPDTVFYPTWQEEKDENGFTWADNPVVTGGAGLYTVVIAQYKNASAAGQPGYGVALVLKEAKDGQAYEEIVAFVPEDHTYGIVGSFEGSNWGEGADVAMESAGDNVWKGKVALKAGDEFKVRADSDWTYSWGNGEDNFKAEADGQYAVTISFDGEAGTVVAEPVDENVVLEDENHECWVAHGQYYLADGTENAWNGKSSELYEQSALTAISMNDVKEISEEVYDALSGKDVKFLYTIDLVFGTNDAGWTSNFLKDDKMYRANGSYCFKIAQCTVDMDGDTKVYAEDQWISDPKTAYVESLTPDTVFYPTWQEEKDENGFTWADNPVVTGGAGLYTVVIAQYKNASAAGQPGYGVAMVLKEEKDGEAYEEIVAYVPADHTYGIVGSFEGSNWGEGADVAMEADGDNKWVGEVELKKDDEFKVRADSDWTYSWGNGEDNFKAEADGTYVVTITFDGEVGTVEAEAK